MPIKVAWHILETYFNGQGKVTGEGKVSLVCKINTQVFKLIPQPSCVNLTRVFLYMIALSSDFFQFFPGTSFSGMNIIGRSNSCSFLL